jgi:hypothetical protein
MHVPIADPVEEREHAHVVGAVAERATEPRLRVGPRDRRDRALGMRDICHDAVVAEQRHPRVVRGVVADQVAFGRDPSSDDRLGLSPSRLDEEGASDAGLRELVEDAPGARLRPRRSVRMLRVEGEGDACHARSSRTALRSLPNHAASAGTW